jgi:O-antigen/teichoic acid export membrane protein
MTDPAPQASPARTAALGPQVAAGFSLMLAQSFAGKLVAAVGQLVLAWYLGPEEFGLMGLAYTVLAFTGLVQYAGLREILARRALSLTRWVDVAFWISIVAGAAAAALTVAVAPLAAGMYGAAANEAGREQLVELLQVMAVAMPFNALATVPLAQLRVGLHFRALTGLALFQGVATMVLSCILAALGFGVFSFALPVPLVAMAHALAAWTVARPRRPGTRNLRRWPHLAAESAKLMGAGVFIHACLQGGAFAIGLSGHSDATVGLFVFALALSMQVAHLLVFNLDNVLLPALGRLRRERDRQREAFLRALRCLLLVGAPLCLLQAAVARPLLALLFADRWNGAVEPLQALSVATVFLLATSPAINFLVVLGRAGLVMGLSALSASAYLAFAFAGAAMGGAREVSIAVALHGFLFAHVFLAAAAACSGARVSAMLMVFLRPTAIGAMAVFAAWWAASLVPTDTQVQRLAHLGVLVASAAAMTAILARALAPREWREVVAVFQRRSPGIAALATEPYGR